MLIPVNWLPARRSSWQGMVRVEPGKVELRAILAFQVTVNSRPLVTLVGVLEEAAR